MRTEKSRTYWKVVINLSIMLVLILLCIFVVPRIIVYFMPFVIGWLIALIASPVVRFFEKKLKVKRKAGSAFVIIAVIGMVILAGYLIGVRLTEEVIDFVAEAPEMWDSMQEDLDAVGEKMNVAYQYLPGNLRDGIDSVLDNVEDYIGSAVGKMSAPTIEAISRLAKNLPGIIIGIVMCLLSAYFFVADREYIPRLISKAMPEALMERWDMIKRGFKRAVGGYFKAQLKIELWMYLLLGIGLSILKVKYAFIIAIGIAFLDLLPFFGTGTVLIPWAIIKFFSADYKMVIGLLIIWGGGQLARQVIQPKIVGDSIGLAPIPTLFLLFVGYKAAGVVGMIIAVPIGIIVLNMYEEGVFDTTLNSIKVLYAGISNFRHLTDEDMEEVRKYKEAEKGRTESRKEALKNREKSKIKE